MSDSDSGSATPRSATPSPPASPDYIPENPEYNPESPGYMPRSPGYSPRSPDSNPESPPNSPRQERVEPVSLVACGGFELYLATGSKIKIDKLFGLVSKKVEKLKLSLLLIDHNLNQNTIQNEDLTNNVTLFRNLNNRRNQVILAKFPDCLNCL